MGKSRVDELLESNKIANKDLKDAVKEHQDYEKDKKKKQLVQQFKELQSILDGRIERLREVRKLESSRKSEVLKADKAMKKFMESGDIEEVKKLL